jgi:hypothetical protein
MPFPPDLLNFVASAGWRYCPRLFHLMQVDGRWDDNVFTEEGRAAHARTDAESDVLPPPSDTVAADGDQVLVVDAGPVEGAHPSPDVAYLGRPYSVAPRCQVV